MKRPITEHPPIPTCEARSGEGLTSLGLRKTETTARANICSRTFRGLGEQVTDELPEKLVD